MSTHKHIDVICVVVVILSLLVTGWFMSGIGLTKQADPDAERYKGVSYFTDNDLNGTWDTAEATTIVLHGTEADIEGTGAYLQQENVVISTEGKYVLRGTWSGGSIVVQANKNAKVWLLLDGVTVSCEDDACLRVDSADKVFLTLAEGSENAFHSGANYSAEALTDGTDGAIFAHDDLTINGTGSLRVTAEYQHGIAANDDLVLVDGTLTIEAVKDGIHANDSLRIRNTMLTVTTTDDGLHCDTEILIAGGSIRILDCFEGIEAPQITIMDGIVEISAMDDGINASGEVGAVMLGKESRENELPTVWIQGGSVTICNAEGRDCDGIDSNGNIVISGGTVFISLNDNGTNTALDYGSENGGVCRIDGGTVITCGGASLLEPMADSSKQASILYLPQASVSAETELLVQSEAGEILLAETIPYTWSAGIISSPALILGESYTITAGEQSATLTLSDTVTSYGENQMAFAPKMGGEFGGEMPDISEWQDSKGKDGTPPDFDGEIPPERMQPPTASEDAIPPNFDGKMPQGERQAPDFPMQEKPTQENPKQATAESETLGTAELWQIGGSVAVLLVALAIAFTYRKRG